MSESTESEQRTYCARCQEWLDGEANLWVEGLEATIEKFSHQLKALSGADEAVKKDLKETVKLLNKKLKEVGAVSPEEDELKDQSGANADPVVLVAEPTADYVFDASSLAPVEA